MTMTGNGWRLVAAAGLVLAAGGWGASIDELVPRVAPAVVVIHCGIAGKLMPSVSAGFLVASNRLVTARHVFDSAVRAEAGFPDGVYVEITGLVAEDPGLDLAVVTFAPARLDVKPLRLAAKPPATGETVWAIGSPLGFDGSVSEGLISRVWPLPAKDGLVLQHSIPMSQGSSGGPLLNRKGEVVGVQSTVVWTHGDRPPGQNLNFAPCVDKVPRLPLLPPRAVGALGVPTAPAGRSLLGDDLDRFGSRPYVQDSMADALPLFEAAVARRPDCADAWFRLGCCRERLGKLDVAEQAYQRALELEPRHLEALNNIGVVYTRQRQLACAEEFLRKAVAVDEHYAMGWLNLAHVGLDAGKPAEAREAARRSVQADANLAAARLALGRAAHRCGDDAEARAQLPELERLDAKLAGELKNELRK